MSRNHGIGEDNSNSGVNGGGPSQRGVNGGGVNLAARIKKDTFWGAIPPTTCYNCDLKCLLSTS